MTKIEQMTAKGLSAHDGCCVVKKLSLDPNDNFFKIIKRHVGTLAYLVPVVLV
jgi:hypothetical protein